MKHIIFLLLFTTTAMVNAEGSAFLKNRENGLCLMHDPKLFVPSMGPCLRSNFGGQQTFNVREVSEGRVQIRSDSSKVMCFTQGEGANKVQRGIRLSSCKTATQFIMKRTEMGNMIFRSDADPSLCISIMMNGSSGWNPVMEPCNKMNSTRWWDVRGTQLSVGAIKSESYKLVASIDSKKCVASKGFFDLPEDAAVIEQECRPKAGSQFWSFEQDFANPSKGRIVVGSSGKCLTVSGAGTAAGTKVNLHTCVGVMHQIWELQETGQTVVWGGEKQRVFKIASAPTGKIVSIILGAEKGKDTEYGIWPDLGFNHQRFIFLDSKKVVK